MKVKFRIQYPRGEHTNKIAAIKAIRAATGMDLQRSKAFFEERIVVCCGPAFHPTAIILDEAQFGRLMISLMCREDPPFLVTHAELVAEGIVRDFTLAAA